MKQLEFGILWIVLTATVLVIPFWMITKKSGHPGWLAMFIVVPGLNLVFLYYLAFSQWKRSPRRQALHHGE